MKPNDTSNDKARESHKMAPQQQTGRDNDRNDGHKSDYRKDAERGGNQGGSRQQDDDRQTNNKR